MANGTANRTAILEEYCGVIVVLDARKLTRLNGTQEGELPPFSNLQQGHFEPEKRFAIRRSVRRFVRRSVHCFARVLGLKPFS